MTEVEEAVPIKRAQQFAYQLETERQRASERENALRRESEIFRSESSAKAVELTLAQVAPTDDGGYQYFSVSELEKRIFIDAFNGFKKYAELKDFC
jgi:hypothetical protein